MSVVTEHLEGRKVPFEVISHEKTYTSVGEAAALGIAADEIVKTLVLDTAAGHVLAVIPGSRRLDMRVVAGTVGDGHARMATEDELERDFPGYELGALPPLGWLVGTMTFVDPEVMRHETVVFASSQTESIRMKTEDLFRYEGVKVAPLTTQSATGESAPE